MIQNEVFWLGWGETKSLRLLRIFFNLKLWISISCLALMRLAYIRGINKKKYFFKKGFYFGQGNNFYNKESILDVQWVLVYKSIHCHNIYKYIIHTNGYPLPL